MILFEIFELNGLFIFPSQVLPLQFLNLSLPSVLFRFWHIHSGHFLTKSWQLLHKSATGQALVQTFLIRSFLAFLLTFFVDFVVFTSGLINGCFQGENRFCFFRCLCLFFRFRFCKVENEGEPLIVLQCPGHSEQGFPFS